LAVADEAGGGVAVVGVKAEDEQFWSARAELALWKGQSGWRVYIKGGGRLGVREWRLAI
jgi:hypothetical protein